MGKRRNHKGRRKSLIISGADQLISNSDDTFSFIVGYTPAGAPYGLTWKNLILMKEKDNLVHLLIMLPFQSQYNFSPIQKYYTAKEN